MRLPAWALKLLFGGNVIILVLLLLSFPYLEPGTGSYVAAVLTLAIVSLSMVLIGITALVYRWLDRRRAAG